jgi:hypothetical protein
MPDRDSVGIAAVDVRLLRRSRGSEVEWGLVGRYPAPRRVPQPAVAGDGAVLDVADDLGCHPVGVAGELGGDGFGERAGRPGELGEAAGQVGEHGVGEPGPDVADVAQALR